jgi:hypothetical protein
VTAALWACRRRNANNDDENEHGPSCSGFKYLEPGEDPGLCHHETLHHAEFGRPPVVRTCASPMDLIGEFEMEVV